jgi:Mg2+/Co2+ transporter CorB
LVGSLLLGNLIVNILFFATASVLAVKLEKQVGTTVAAIVAFISFVLLILCGWKKTLKRGLISDNYSYLPATIKISG